MGMRMKYFIVDTHPHGGEVPVLFAETLEHGNVYHMGFAHLGPAVAGGFVSMDFDGLIRTTGHSHSLGVKRRDQDTKLIERHLGFEDTRYRA